VTSGTLFSITRARLVICSVVMGQDPKPGSTDEVSGSRVA
jgi:hypothetical protein